MPPRGSGVEGDHRQFVDDWFLAEGTMMSPVPRCPLHLETVASIAEGALQPKLPKVAAESIT